MVCPRCGATFQGNFCPRCGAPAVAPAAPPPLAFSVTCPRCGTAYQGRFCPACGLPAGASPHAVLPPQMAGSPDLRRALSVIWTIALVGFFVLVAMNFAGLFLSPPSVIAGIQGIASGRNANQNLTQGDAGWSFQALNASAATGTYVATGGNPDGYLAMTLPAGAAVGGEWVQSLQLTGSAPYLVEVQLDFRTQTAGSLVVTVESAPAGLNYSAADAILPVNATSAWTTTDTLDVSATVGDPGTYFLKVAFLAANTASSTVVDLDNVHLGWVTDAVAYWYIPLPLPVILGYTQAAAPFIAWYLFLIVALVGVAVAYLALDRKLLPRAFRAKSDDVGARLRSMSAWVATAQVWLAASFFQTVVIYVVFFLGIPLTTPVNVTSTNGWALIYELTNASVYEEIAFRLFLIGVPMAVAFVLYRVAGLGSQAQTGAPRGRSDLRRFLGYLWGGQLRRESSREARLLAAFLVLVSATLWAVAHAEGGGWGWWKVLPVFVSGLGAGYLYVRHGLGASILFHFATDGSLALTLEGVGGRGLLYFTNFYLDALAFVGLGFFVWYLLYTWEEVQDLRRRSPARIVRQAAAAAPPTAAPPGNWSYAPPPVSLPGPTNPPPPSPPSPYAPPQTGAPPPPTAVPTRTAAQLPQGYSPTYHPPPYGYPPVRFQCPYCGWVEARYENRAFTCLRCGRTA